MLRDPFQSLNLVPNSFFEISSNGSSIPRFFCARNNCGNCLLRINGNRSYDDSSEIFCLGNTKYNEEGGVSSDHGGSVDDDCVFMAVLAVDLHASDDTLDYTCSQHL